MEFNLCTRTNMKSLLLLLLISPSAFAQETTPATPALNQGSETTLSVLALPEIRHPELSLWITLSTPAHAKVPYTADEKAELLAIYDKVALEVKTELAEILIPLQKDFDEKFSA